MAFLLPILPGIVKRRTHNTTSAQSINNTNNNNKNSGENNRITDIKSTDGVNHDIKDNDHHHNNKDEHKRCYNDLYGCIVEDGDEVYTSHLYAMHCHCKLDYNKFFFSSADIPTSLFPSMTLLYRCEYHELLRCLPPRMQNYPWHLAFDTARDGFSLRNFYRCMEENALRYHAACVGVLLVTSRDDVHDKEMKINTQSSSPQEVEKEEKRQEYEEYKLHHHDQHEHEHIEEHLHKGKMEAIHNSKNNKEWRENHPKYGLIGCFTVEAPSLNVHSEHAFFGNAETFVFRFNAPPSRATNVHTKESENNNNIDNSTNSVENKPIEVKNEDDDGDKVEKKEELSTDELATKCATPVRMLDVYRWSKSSNTTHFILCRHDIFSVGGGVNGAALTFDASLQYGTSSHHCRSFNSPSLFDDADQMPLENELTKGDVPQNEQRRDSHRLPHTEFMIVRMAWFAIHHDHTVEFRQSLMHSSSPTVNNNSNNINNDVPNVFSLGIGFDNGAESNKNTSNNYNSNGNVIELDKQTFHEHFEAEKISRCNCGRRACSQSLWCCNAINERNQQVCTSMHVCNEEALNTEILYNLCA